MSKNKSVTNGPVTNGPVTNGTPQPESPTHFPPSFYSSLFPHILPSRPNKPDLFNLHTIDIGCLPLIAEMEQYGTRIDMDGFKQLEREVEEEIEKIKAQIVRHVPEERFAALAGENKPLSNNEWGEDAGDSASSPLLSFNPSSSEQVAWLLFDVLGLGKGVALHTTPDGTRFSTSRKQLEMLKGQYEVVKLLLHYRELTKLLTTYIRALPKIAIKHPKGVSCRICGRTHEEVEYRIHTRFVTTRAATGRPASRNPNLQNIPARTELGRKVRALFIPSAGNVWVSVDESQIELRALAHCSGDKTMLKIYEEDGDIHERTARAAFNLGPDDKVDKFLHRAPSKTVNFGIAYGMSPVGLYSQLVLMFHQEGRECPDWLTVDWCEEFIAKWFGVYKDVKGYMDWIAERTMECGMIWNEFGRVRILQGVWSTHQRVVSEVLRQAGNMPIQSFAADLMKLWMGQILRVDGGGLLRRWRKEGQVYPLLTVHDELDFEVEEGMGEMVMKEMAEVVKWLGEELKLQCPLKAEGSVTGKWEK